MTEQRVLPADVYDALELSALVFGGIGGLLYNEYGENGLRQIIAPRCYLGHLAWIGVLDRNANGLPAAESFAGIDSALNDRAVECVNERRSREPYDRISFKQWCKALNVVRGT